MMTPSVMKTRLTPECSINHETGLVIFKTSFVQLNSTSLLFLVLSAACSFHHCCCCQLGSNPVFTHECLSKIGFVTLK